MGITRYAWPVTSIEAVLRRFRNAAARLILKPPFAARHSEHSLISSADGVSGPPNPRLLDLAISGINAARTQDLTAIKARLRGRFSFPDDLVEIWPGEHYKLIAGLVAAIRPRVVVEIGTAEGMSALALKKNLQEDGKVVTFDIIPWRSYPRTCLEESDFADGRLQQEVADLGERRVFDRYRTILAEASLFFIDAAKDGVLEARIIRNLSTLKAGIEQIVIFDDIRVWNMLATWHELAWPKLDLTSFGHWSGTGICALEGEG